MRSVICTTNLLIGITFLLISCETVGLVNIDRREDIKMVIMGEPQTIQYGLRSFQRASILNNNQEMSNSYTDINTKKAIEIPMDMEISIPSTILFSRNKSISCFYKFNYSSVIGTIKIKIYKNNVFQREIDFDSNYLLGPVIVNFI